MFGVGVAKSCLVSILMPDHRVYFQDRTVLQYG